MDLCEAFEPLCNLGLINNGSSGLNNLSNLSSISDLHNEQATGDNLAPEKHMPVGMTYLINMLGTPDLADSTICLWSGTTLSKRGFPANRVEFIDERVTSRIPYRHYTNTYLYKKIEASNYQQYRLNEISPDLWYDRNKKTLIVREKNIRTAVALCALSILYIRGKISMCDIINKKLVWKFYETSKKDRHFKGMLHVLSGHP